MDHPQDHTGPSSNQRPSFFKGSAGVAVAMLAVIAGFYFLREHWQHVAGSWPYLLLLACPLMHMFHGHGGHGGHHHHGPGRNQPDPNKKDW